MLLEVAIGPAVSAALVARWKAKWKSFPKRRATKERFHNKLLQLQYEQQTELHDLRRKQMSSLSQMSPGTHNCSWPCYASIGSFSLRCFRPTVDMLPVAPGLQKVVAAELDEEKGRLQNFGAYKSYTFTWFSIYLSYLERPQYFKMEDPFTAWFSGMASRPSRDMVPSKAACSSFGVWFVVLPWCPGLRQLWRRGLGRKTLRCPLIEASWCGHMVGRGLSAELLIFLKSGDALRFCVADEPEADCWGLVCAKDFLDFLLCVFIAQLGLWQISWDYLQIQILAEWKLIGPSSTFDQDWYVKLFGDDSESSGPSFLGIHWNMPSTTEQFYLSGESESNADQTPSDPATKKCPNSMAKGLDKHCRILQRFGDGWNVDRFQP